MTSDVPDYLDGHEPPPDALSVPEAEGRLDPCTKEDTQGQGTLPLQQLNPGDGVQRNLTTNIFHNVH